MYIRRAAEGTTRRLAEDTEARLLAALREVALQLSLELVIFGDSPLPSFRETLNLFSRAAFIVGVHGAGFSNMIVSPGGALPPGQEGRLSPSPPSPPSGTCTTVLEFVPPEPHAQYYAHLASTIGASYRSLAFNDTPASYVSTNLTIPQEELALAIGAITADLALVAPQCLALYP